MFSKVLSNNSKMADNSFGYVAADSLNISPPNSDTNIIEAKPHSSITTAEKTPKKRGRKRKSEKSTIPTEEANGPRPVKRGRGRPPRSSQVTNTSNGQLTGGDEPEGANAARERSRVKTLRDAFLELQRSLPSVPPDTKLSKLDVLVLATTYISHLMKTLDDGGDSDVMNRNSSSISEKQHRLKAHGLLHPVKKWPMRSRLYAGAGGIPVPSTLDKVSPSSTSV
ncbi:transcription factor 23-like [Apostichopus japonicus]|uniref:transcription factor 23-like n=1 Tax=Stichopus japonicus TaxID=307972 RepID=UPI003AB91142